MKNKVIEIALPFWKNPQCYILTQHVRDEVDLYVDCWNENAEHITGHLGHLHFDGVVHIQTSRQVKKYFPKLPLYQSSIYEVINSKAIKKYIQKRKKWNNKPISAQDYHYYVVDSHDHQICIIAKSYQCELVPINSQMAWLYQKIVGGVA